VLTGKQINRQTNNDGNIILLGEKVINPNLTNNEMINADCDTNG